MKFKLEYQAAVIATSILAIGMYAFTDAGVVRIFEVVNVVLFMTMAGYLSVEFAFKEHEQREKGNL